MKKLLSLLMIMTLVAGSTYASFPVQNSNKTTIVDSKNNTSTTLSANEANEMEESLTSVAENGMAPKDLDEKTMLILLWLLLGSFAAHRWYKGKDPLMNILYIITAGGCGIWAIIDLIAILKGKF